MKKHLVRPLVLILTAALLVLGYDVATYAANGDSLLLGRINKASRITTVNRTTHGPVLALKGRSGSAPMTVSSSRKVARLNADQVDGFDAAALQTRTTTYVLSGGGPASTVLRWLAPMSPGTYLVSWSAALYGSTGEIRCGFFDPDVSGNSGFVSGQQTRASSVLDVDTVSWSGTVTIPGATAYVFACRSSEGDMNVTGGGVQMIVQEPAGDTRIEVPAIQ